MSSPVLLELNRVNYSYDGENLVLKDLSFQVARGKTLGIIGPNGGGKSTLSKILTGQLTPTSGEFKICGQEVASHGPFPTHAMAYVPQGHSVQTCLPISLLDFIRMGQNSLDLPSIQTLLVSLDLWEKKDHLLGQLSGGQLQKALLAHALIQRSQILVMDEPRSALDSRGQDQFLSVIEGLPERQNMAIVLVEHDIHSLTRICDQILCLNKTYHWHDTSELFNNQIMESIYHCELEHIQIHEKFGAGHDHKECSLHDHHLTKEKK